jgi:hypothetical protein
MPKSIKIFSSSVTKAFDTSFFYVPKTVRQVLLQASAYGGDGGDANGIRCGGGGGAGGYIDEIIDIMPGSVIQFIEVGGGALRGLQVGFQNRDGSYDVRHIWNGRNGGAASGAAVGVGGESGNGNAGGLITSIDATVPFGFKDGNGYCHSTGGFAATSAAPIIYARDYAYNANGAGAAIERCKLKFPSALRTGANQPGSGGCSYWSAGGTLEGGLSAAGFGAGGCGAFSGFAPQVGGNGFIAVSWIW